jgi:hypothetical protein
MKIVYLETCLGFHGHIFKIPADNNTTFESIFDNLVTEIEKSQYQYIDLIESLNDMKEEIIENGLMDMPFSVYDQYYDSGNPYVYFGVKQ